MRILANENMPADAVDALRSAGHDVAWVRVDAPGSPDEAVLARAAAEHRLLITFDKDFGDLDFGAGQVGVRRSRALPHRDAVAIGGRQENRYRPGFADRLGGAFQRGGRYQDPDGSVTLSAQPVIGRIEEQP